MRFEALSLLLLATFAHGRGNGQGNAYAYGKFQNKSASKKAADEEDLATKEVLIAKQQLAAAQAQLEAAKAELLAEGGAIDEDGNVVLPDTAATVASVQPGLRGATPATDTNGLGEFLTRLLTRLWMKMSMEAILPCTMQSTRKERFSGMTKLNWTLNSLQ